MLKKHFSILIISLLLFSRLSSEDIHLSYNENPFGPLPSVRMAMERAVGSSNRYALESYTELIQQLTTTYPGVKEDQILLSSGLSSIFPLIAETFLGPGKTIIAANPSYEYMKIVAEARGTQVVEVPLTADYAHDLNAMLAKVDESTKLIYICNPNNPTATITPRSEIEAFIKKLPPDVYVFIDEAYHHFAIGSKDYTSFIDAPINDDRLIVGRTFSKIYGMASMRLGYVVSAPSTINKLKKYIMKDPVSVAALQGGIAGLKDEEGLQEMTKKFEQAKSEFCRQAEARGLTYIPSHASFIMLETGGKPAQEVIKYFADNHIILGREFPALPTYLRISFGTPAEMETFWKVWDTMPKS